MKWYLRPGFHIASLTIAFCLLVMAILYDVIAGEGFSLDKIGSLQTIGVVVCFVNVLVAGPGISLAKRMWG